MQSISGSMSSTIGELNPFRYKDYYYDRESQMYYCHTRYYVPDWGRWLNADHSSNLNLFSLCRVNLFSYCENNPVKYFDPSGKSATVAIVLMIIGAVVGAAVSASIAKKENKKGWDFAKTVILGTFIGIAAGGLAAIFAGAMGCVVGLVALDTAKTIVAAGMLGFNFFAVVIGPLYGIEVEPLDLSPTPGTPSNDDVANPGPECIHPADKKK